MFTLNENRIKEIWAEGLRQADKMNGIPAATYFARTVMAELPLPEREPVAYAVYAEVDGEMVAQWPLALTLDKAEEHRKMYAAGVKTETRPLYDHTAPPLDESAEAFLAAVKPYAREQGWKFGVERKDGKIVAIHDENVSEMWRGWRVAARHMAAPDQPINTEGLI